MDYLALVKRLRRETGIGGGDPTSVTTLVSDDHQSLADWVQDAWRDIQLMPRNWRWMRAQALGSVTVVGGRGYTVDQLLGVAAGTTRFARWMPDSNRYHATAFDPANPASEWRLHEIDYETFRLRFEVSSHAAGAPQYRATAPDGRLLVGPTPDKTYSIRLDYWKTPQKLVANTDTPEMPEQYHMAIVWRALMSYAGFDAASEVYARGYSQYQDLESALIRDQGDTLYLAARPLA